MTISLLHSFVNPASNLPGFTGTKPGDWNAQHSLQLAGGNLLGRGTAGTGAAEEISLTNDTNVTLTLTAGNLAAGWTGTLAAGRLNANVVQGITNDTNVTGSIASQVLTLGWTGTLAVPRGGTGVGTFTLNGVLYGNGTSNILVTAAAGTGMVLAASGGPPTFTATPTINTSVTCPLIIGGTAASSTLTLQSTSGVGTTDAIYFYTGNNLNRGRFDTGGLFIIGGVGVQVANEVFEIVSGTGTTLGTAVPPIMSMIAYATPIQAPQFVMRVTKNNTVGSFGATVASDILGNVIVQGSSASAFHSGFSIVVTADGTWTEGSSYPTRWYIASTQTSGVAPGAKVGGDGAGFLYFNMGNTSGLFPGTTIASNLAKGWNASGGGQEVDYYNTVTASTWGHSFYQQTGASAATRICSFGTSNGIEWPGIATSASAASAFIDTTANNQMFRSTSSIRYKRDVTPVLQSRIDAIADLEPIEFTSTCLKDDPTVRHIGLIAEDVAEIDPHLVHWGYEDSDFEDDEFGQNSRNTFTPVLKEGARLKPENVQYDRLLLLQVAALRRRITALEARMSA
jgi:hypothetical protein